MLDLADAHIRVLDRLTEASCRYNIGNGTGYSVRRSSMRWSGSAAGRCRMRFGPRRPGDPAVLVASSAKLRQETGWTPRFGALDDIVRTAWDWHSNHPKGFDDRG